MKPKPIKVRGRGDIEIKIIGYKHKESAPYMYVSSGFDYVAGYIEDRDVKRLRAWCDDCLKKRGKK